MFDGLGPELGDGGGWSPSQRSSLSVDNNIDPWITVGPIVSTYIKEIKNTLVTGVSQCAP